MSSNSNDSPPKSLEELSQLISGTPEIVSGVPPTLNPTPSLTRATEDMIVTEVKAWMRGEKAQTPKAIRQMMGAMTEKVNWAVMYLLVKRLDQAHRLETFLTSLEEELLDPVKHSSLGIKDKHILHKELSRGLLDTLEFTRKFTAQAKEDLDAKDDPYRDLLERLRSIPIEKLEKAIAQLEIE